MQMRSISPLLLALMLAACGGSDDSSTAPLPPPQPMPVPPPSPMPTPTPMPTPPPMPTPTPQPQPQPPQPQPPQPTPTPVPTTTPTPTPTPTTTPSRFPPSASLANVCTPEGERRFIRSLIDEKYLWYSEVRDAGANTTSTVQDYFDSLLVKTPDRNGLPKDRFSYIGTLDPGEKSSATKLDFGIRWTESNPRRITYVLEGSPADRAGLKRGAVLTDVIAANNMNN